MPNRLNPPGPPEPRTRPPSDREVFLDAIRAFAIVRVILWHAFGAAVITYFFSAVPAMFFVTGSLLAKSFRSRTMRAVLLDRGKRLLVPLWAFALAAFAAMTTAAIIIGTPDTRVPWHRIVFWIVPVADPQGSAWEGGYIASPLWYLRTLFWLLLLSPLLFAAVRRYRVAAFAVPLGIVFILDFLSRDPRFIEHFAPLVQVPWVVGDIALYSTFLMLGFVHREGGFARLTQRHWFIVAITSGAVATEWCLTQPVPGGVVNNSHPAHLFVGLAWLALAFAFEPFVVSFAGLRFVAPVVTWVTRRSLTIYLWHSVAITSAYALVARFTDDHVTRVVAVILIVAAITLMLTLAFGWIEDLAGGRRPQCWPVPTTRRAPAPWTRPDLRIRPTNRTPLGARLAVAAGMLCLIGSAAVVTQSPIPATAAPRVPSQAPKAIALQDAVSAVARPVSAGTDRTSNSPTASVARESRSADASLPPARDTAKSTALQRVVDQYIASGANRGVQVAVVKPGQWSWVSASGTTTDGKPLRSDDAFLIDSATKTFTAALILRAADARLINLDAPLPVLSAVPDFTYATRFTARQLLEHRTGLVNYRDTPEYRSNPAKIATPQAALRASQAQRLHFAPGTDQEYSSSNYLVLGFLLEQVYHRSYDDLLQHELLEPVGLSKTTHDRPEPGRPNFSTAGITTTISDLATWTAALLRTNEVVSEAGARSLHHVDPETAIGGGANAFCPCVRSADGTTTYAAYGFSAATTIITYAPASDLVIVINTSEPFTATPNTFQRPLDLITALRNTAARLPA